ncbi:MAG: YicC/YloC family endoribonuclease [Pseudomonadota bacterium]
MSVQSMTAFAREASATPNAIVVELRSVNHRYLDCHFKLPDALRSLEPRFREALSTKLARGKIDCLLRIDSDAGRNELRVNEERLGQLASAIDTLRAGMDDLAPASPVELLNFPGVCVGAGQDEEAQLTAAMQTFSSALDTLRAARAREGEQLQEFLLKRLASLEEEARKLREVLPALRQAQEERLRGRLAEVEEPVDEGRLEQEMVLVLHKSDIDEELDRLDAHLMEVKRVLDKGGPCGRRLDFMMQELNREANTIASKASASLTTQAAVELKVLIEQMREQVQNIE